MLFGRDRERRGLLLQLPCPAGGVEPAEGGQRLADDLVHVVIAIGRQPADEGDAGRGIGQRFILLVERLILLARDRIIRIAFGAWIFQRDAGLAVLLPSQMLIR
jgi:hypothetical protein